MRTVLVRALPPLRSLLCGISLLALLAGSTTSASAAEIFHTFLFGTVPWEFSTVTNTFSGEQVGGLAFSPTLAGTGSLQVLFDDLGNFQSGTWEVRRYPDDALLLKGTVAGHNEPVDQVEHFWTIFDLGVDFSSPLLGFPVHYAAWWTYICKGGPEPSCGAEGPETVEEPATVAELFTTDYSDASVPLHNYLFIYTVVPSPSPGVLLGLGLAMLAAIRMRRSIKAQDKTGRD